MTRVGPTRESRRREDASGETPGETERGRGWALALGLGAVDVYQKSHPVLAAMGRHSITEVLTEH